MVAGLEVRDAVVRYGALKRDLAERFPHSREGYTEEKGPFIQALLNAP